ncbi:uncharacterized protein C7orf57 homolog isoform X3 [Pyxicephalus adspersus]|uniref:uncharacterized protein C7orf57 homolog isoform X3 n=1 Tax=Pyxicephalus adspersus TaxID=30357 RepID=UPI003B592A59
MYFNERGAAGTREHRQSSAWAIKMAEDPKPKRGLGDDVGAGEVARRGKEAMRQIESSAAPTRYATCDLLKHVTSVQKKAPPVSYAPPDWYTYENNPPPEPAVAPLKNVPDYMIHEEFNVEQNEKYEAKKGPFDFDEKTVWQRESVENEKENHHDKTVKLPAIKHDNNVTASGKGPPPTKTKQNRPGKKCVFPPMPGNKNDVVNIGKLLSNGYGDDWLLHNGEQEMKAAQKSKTFKSGFD